MGAAGGLGRGFWEGRRSGWRLTLLHEALPDHRSGQERHPLSLTARLRFVSPSRGSIARKAPRAGRYSGSYLAGHLWWPSP
jgi:hypothetical protein